jgi:murein L,D-transpeptidase YcbB/YkuD
MKRIGSRFFPAFVVAIAAAMPVPVQAENLFDMLFGNQRARQPYYGRDYDPNYRQLHDRRGFYNQQYDNRRYQLPPDYKPAKVSAPIYYTYKPEAIVKVDFSKTLAAPTPSTLAPSLGDNGFFEARDALNTMDISIDKPIAKALDDYYSKHPGFIWVSGYSANAKAEDAIDILSRAEEEGLSPADYSVQRPANGFDLSDIAARRAELMRFEMSLSAKVLRYIRDVHSGRINPNLLSGYHDFPSKNLDMEGALAALDGHGDVAAYLESMHPANQQYAELKTELADLRESSENDIVINNMSLLKPGQSDPEFPKVIKIIEHRSPEPVLTEFADLLSVYNGTDEYSEDFVPLIKAAQKAAGTTPDGVIGRMTIKALFGTSKQDKIDKVVMAMERLRWLPSELGARRVFINQPAFMAYYINGGKTQLSTKVVVGKKSNQTSFFYDQIEEVVYNPYWGVPQSILINEMLPKLLEDPSYLDRAGYEITTDSGEVIPSSYIDWWQYRDKIPYNVRQLPGEANALGDLKILFPNKHAIYMHDTPAKNLFSRDMRAYSHGCIRLEKPREMAAAVLGTQVSHINGELRMGHSTEKVPVKIPVYVSYFTAWPDDEGVVHYYPDVYDRDRYLMKAVNAVTDTRSASG